MMVRTHGKESTYKNGCRCQSCKTAHAEAAARYRDNNPGPKEHGTIYAYRVLGCRCDDCREANRVYQAAYRAALR